MRVVILSEIYSPQMGYAENLFPKFLARLGVDVHLVTAGLHPYYDLPDFHLTYDTFVNAANNKYFSERMDGYAVHYLKHSKLFGYIRMKKLYATLRELKPDIVQTFAAISWIPLEAAIIKPLLGYKLFTGCHSTASTFLLAKRLDLKWDTDYIKCMLTRFIHGRFISLHTEKCYAVTVDCADIAKRFFGVQRNKVEIMHLGVDTDVFFTGNSEELVHERRELREKLGFAESDIVCIYTGKLTKTKNALILAEAIARLRAMGKPFSGVFIGDGAQREAIEAHKSCITLPFMPYRDLAPFYRAADIGVWPTDESTSMLDAAACGLPIIVSDGIVYREHIEGNGLIFKINNLNALVHALLMLRDRTERVRLGSFGAKKMASYFSWDSVARRRLKDYEMAIRTIA
jgi:Glycosyltransferase